MRVVVKAICSYGAHYPCPCRRLLCIGAVYRTGAVL